MNLPNCDKCGKEQSELGALLFSPPFNNEKFCAVNKYHICRECFMEMKP